MAFSPEQNSPVPYTGDSTQINSVGSPLPPLIRLQLIPWSTVPMVKPVLHELVERRVRDGQKFKIGRQVTKEIQPGQPIPPLEDPNPLDCWFLSKVVSRQHAEFSIVDGTDVGSSSGTFLNKLRLSPTTKESKPFPVKEGDIIQFGVDYKGRPDDVYKSITVRVGFYDQSWVHMQRKKANPTNLLNSTNSSHESQRDDAEVTECCICYEETGPFQALFLAPCSHCYHYKCVMSIIVQSAMFQCPLCRQVANLTASVSTENLNAIPIEDEEVAVGAKGDPKKFLQAAQNIQNAIAAAEVAAATVAALKKKGKRPNSFTSRITTLFNRRTSSAGRSPGGENNASPLRNTINPAQFEAVLRMPDPESDHAEPIVVTDESETSPVIQNEIENVVDSPVEAEPLYVVETGEFDASNIPRSATAATFEQDDEEEGQPVVLVNIMPTMRESFRELPYNI